MTETETETGEILSEQMKYFSWFQDLNRIWNEMEHFSSQSFHSDYDIFTDLKYRLSRVIDLFQENLMRTDILVKGVKQIELSKIQENTDEIKSLQKRLILLEFKAFWNLDLDRTKEYSKDWRLQVDYK